jgi:hypothetical protein
MTYIRGPKLSQKFRKPAPDCRHQNYIKNIFHTDLSSEPSPLCYSYNGKQKEPNTTSACIVSFYSQGVA